MKRTFLILLSTCMVCAAQVSSRQIGRVIGYTPNQIFPYMPVFTGDKSKYFLNVRPNFESLLKRILFATSTTETTTKAPETTQQTLIFSYHEFQIADLHKTKWISKDIGLHDTVTLSKEVSGSELWRLERKQNEALWSFHVLSKEGEKLYLSYEDNSTDVTMELEDDSKGGKQRFFHILLQDMDIYRIQAHSNGDRYLNNKNGKLKMFTQTDGDEDEQCSELSANKTEREKRMMWMIKEHLDEKFGSPRPYQIQDKNLKWISGQANSDQLVQLGQKSSIQKWNITFSSNLWKFSPVSFPHLYATITESSPGKILFAGSRSELILRVYRVHSCSKGRYRFQSNFSSGWLAPSKDDSHIVAVKDQKHSAKWLIPNLHFPYNSNNAMQLFPSDSDP